MTEPTYPFVPKSSRGLRPGQFWGVPAGDGWACGRVLALPPDGAAGSRVMFLAGLMDWLGDALPTVEDLADVGLLAQGESHYKTIEASGGSPILGVRPLDDNSQHRLWRSAAFGDCDVLDYLTVVRRATEDDKANLPARVTWQGDFIRQLAARLLGDGPPLRRSLSTSWMGPSEPAV